MKTKMILKIHHQMKIVIVILSLWLLSTTTKSSGIQSSIPIM